MALTFLLRRFFFRIADFFHHWYVDGSKSFFHGFLSLLEFLDRTFAVAVTARFFFSPLYGDYTFIGRVLGVIFRTLRILFGSVVYVLAAVGFAFVYLSWLLIPILIIYLIFISFQA